MTGERQVMSTCVQQRSAGRQVTAASSATAQAAA
eukprot:CAMPEP_0118869484 /NCGR_PEP_ID=MMETSP1163-20130328/12806_1 /TAXON_ID=124430 /ORGANISM="Phaeomonas parva, Strain CCMP2877" /LENGTH=33 /DNA_ID= /DNA_START= /DNA_END= /DNA_ORIENTATION=